MTSPSKLSVLAALLGAALVGCSSGGVDASASTAPKAPDAAAAQMQSGEGGRKAAAGGGVAPLGLEPAKPGQKTGALEGGRK